MEALLKAGANVHADNDQALVYASSEGHLETVMILLEYWANLHADNDWALREASLNGHLEVVKELLKV